MPGGQARLAPAELIRDVHAQVVQRTLPVANGKQVWLGGTPCLLDLESLKVVERVNGRVEEVGPDGSPV